ncbi:hypothetical protein D3C71_1958080 [compost metagenome]
MHAAIMMAVRGGRARVDTEVAMAFAVSWNPLIKSNPSASTITIPSTNKDVSIFTAPYELRIIIDSSMLATSSHLSVVVSSRSYSSLRLMSSIGSLT